MIIQLFLSTLSSLVIVYSFPNYFSHKPINYLMILLDDVITEAFTLVAKEMFLLKKMKSLIKPTCSEQEFNMIKFCEC